MGFRRFFMGVAVFEEVNVTKIRASQTLFKIPFLRISLCSQ